VCVCACDDHCVHPVAYVECGRGDFVYQDVGPELLVLLSDLGTISVVGFDVTTVCLRTVPRVFGCWALVILVPHLGPMLHLFADE
jgi:hypothetical protein